MSKLLALDEIESHEPYDGDKKCTYYTQCGESADHIVTLASNGRHKYLCGAHLQEILSNPAGKHKE